MPTFLTRAASAALLLAACSTSALAQAPAPESIVSIYRAAPGHQTKLLQWLARQDEAGRAAGLAPGQIFVHQSGASWDYIVITPVTTPEQDRAQEAAARRMGLATGARAGLEIREHIAEHSDTRATGPMTVAEWLRRLGR